MLRYNKNESKQTAESMQRDRLVEKAIGKFVRKIELMVEAKLPREHILSAAAQYGLEVSDFSEKVSKYLTPASEPASKAEKKPEKSQAKKKEVKAAEPVSEEKPESTDAQ